MREYARWLTTGRWGVTLLALSWCGMAWSQAMTDPTRPAPALLAAPPQVPGALTVEQDTSPTLQQLPAARLKRTSRLTVDTSPTLQLLLIGRSRKYAIIDGQLFQPGDTYNGYTLVAIKPDRVVLQSNDTLRTLKMHPAIKKTVITPTSAKTGRPASKRKIVVNGENK